MLLQNIAREATFYFPLDYYKYNLSQSLPHINQGSKDE